MDFDEHGERLEREAAVLAPLLEDTLGWLHFHLDRLGVEVGRVMDVGCGPGVISARLAQRFEDALVIAVDDSEPLLERVAANAARGGVGQRVFGAKGQLPDSLPDESVDLVWASMVLHHVDDQVAALRAMSNRLSPAGVIMLVEFGEPVRYLPEDDGLEDRLDDVVSHVLAEESRHHDLDVEDIVSASGLNLAARGQVATPIPPPLDADARRLVRDSLLLVLDHAGDELGVADRDRLVALTSRGPDSVTARDDVFISTSRTLYLVTLA
jgi:SAM-dependent methyltransferase